MPRTACLTAEELLALHVGDVPETDLEDLALHLEHCALCEAAAQALDNVPDTVVAAYRQSARSGPVAGAAPPRQVGEYEIVGEIGRGGMGVVYYARHRRLRRNVALKMMLGGPFAERQARARFRTEAEAVAKLQHPGIVQIYEVGEHDVGDGCPRPYFTLELVEGGNLTARLGGRPQPPRQAAAWLEGLARTAHYAHQQGIVHRDLKPSNVLVTADGQLKLCDFGVAKLLTGSEFQTGSGMLLGTAEYMAPEQALGQSAVGPTADVYALGAILYTALTGRPPFQDTSTLRTLERVRNQEPVSPRRLQPRIDRDLETICLKCLQKEPARRYPGAEALADDLHRFLAGEPILARPVGIWGRAVKWARRRPAVAGLLGAVVVMTAVALVLITSLWQMAEARASDEAKARGIAQEKEQQEKKARHESAHLLARVTLEHGLSLCARGEVDHGLLHLARGLDRAVAVGDPDLERVARINLTAWRPRLVQLRAALSHRSWVWGVAFSNDNRTALTASYDQTVRQWDAVTGRQKGRDLRHAYPVWAAVFSPDSGTILTGSGSHQGERFGEVRLFDTARGEALGPPLPMPEKVHHVEFTADGRRFLAVCDEAVRVWPADDASSTGLLLAHPKPGAMLADVRHRLSAVFSPDGRTVLTGGEDGTARLWDAATGRRRGVMLRHAGPVLAVAFSPDGRTMATGCYDGTAQLWDAATGQPRGPALPILGRVRALAFSDDSRLLATGSEAKEVGPATQDRRGVGGEARLWRAATGEAVGPPLPHPRAVTAVAFRPGARLFLTGSVDMTARFFDVASGALLGRPQEHDGTVTNVAFSPDGRLAVTASAGGGVPSARLWVLPPDPGDLPPTFPVGHADQKTTKNTLALLPDAYGLLRLTDGEQAVRVVDAASGKGRGPALRPGGPITWAACSRNGRAVLTVGPDNTAFFWERETSHLLGRCRLPADPVTAAYRDDGREVLIAFVDQTAGVWQATTGRPVGSLLRLPARAERLALSADGGSVLSRHADGTVSAWDVRTGRRRDHGRLPGAVAFLGFVAGKAVVVTAEPGQSALVWDLAGRRPLGPPLAEPTGVLGQQAFDADDRTLLTGGWDRQQTRLWDLATGLPLGLPVWHSDRVLRVGLSADRRWMMSFSNDGQVQQVRVPAALTGEPERVQCWVEVLTGLELDGQGAVRRLDEAALRQRQEYLRQLGGPPGGWARP
jgi:WD40 repeat protein